MNKSIFDHLETYGNKIALYNNKLRPYTYSELITYGDKIAGLMETRSLIIIICQNEFECISVYAGCMRRRIVPILVGFEHKNCDLECIVNLYKPEYIYCSTYINLCIDGFKCMLHDNKFRLFKFSLKVDISLNDDLALLLSTSGSLGSPKFVRLSYHNITVNTDDIVNVLPMNSDDIAITTLPFNLTYGLSIIHTHLYIGASVILNEYRVTSDEFKQLLISGNATNFGGVPFTYELMSKFNFFSDNYVSLRYITQAGGALPLHLIRELFAISCNKNFKFYIMYGQTEATARMCILQYEDLESHIGSIGIPLLSGKVNIVNDNNEGISTPFTEGEIVYYGDNVMMGYADSYLDLPLGNVVKGELYTGDIGYLDKEKYLFITGRKKRFIKINGVRFSLDDMEKKLSENGYESACAGKDDFVTVYLVNRQNNKIKDISNSLSDILNIKNWYINIKFVDELPRTSNGKVDYVKLT